MLKNDLKLARLSIRAAKWRSMLTILGIVIGVASVVITVSLGEGVKRDVISQINHLGSDLITVRPGKIVNRDENGNITNVNFFSVFNTGALTEDDYSSISKSKGVKLAVPFALMNGVPQTDSREMPDALVVATTKDLPDALKQKIEYGGFFEDSGGSREVAVIGKRVAERLFQEPVPIGKTMRIRGTTFVVRGVFEQFDASPFTPNTDYNSAIFIPYDTGKKLSGGHVQMYQVLAKPQNPNDTNQAIQAITNNLTHSHNGQEDFTILKQGESLTIANKVINLFTGLISGIAAISLIVGGIGIMNIMFVSVTERTREIGLRKAVGGTNRQILGQFLVEAVMLSLVGGLVGVLVSLVADFIIRLSTDLQPVLSWPVMVLAVMVAVAVGVFFGVTPAIKAARKDPIEALRHD
jgi:ABC-type antimicrobial peptide transport system permease subunit